MHGQDLIPINYLTDWNLPVGVLFINKPWCSILIPMALSMPHDIQCQIIFHLIYKSGSWLNMLSSIITTATPFSYITHHFLGSAEFSSTCLLHFMTFSILYLPHIPTQTDPRYLLACSWLGAMVIYKLIRTLNCQFVLTLHWLVEQSNNTRGMLTSLIYRYLLNCLY